MKGAKLCWNSFNKHFYSLAIAGLFLFSKQKGVHTLHNLILPVEEPKAEPDEDAGRKPYQGSDGYEEQ